MPLSILASVFPLNQQIDTLMGHNHLLTAYFFTWGLQLAYLGYIGLKWRAVRKSDQK
jgi:hypothetical protein